jgi:CrcB protein
MGFRPSLRKRRVFSGQGMWKSVLAISIGAALGALLRWQFGIRLNSLFPTVPPGTLVANLVGAYLIGLAVAFFTSFPAISPEWRLLIITGFCGGLTTFSTFSAELTLLLQQGRLSWALAAAAAHVVGSVLMTFAGMATVVWAQGSR